MSSNTSDVGENQPTPPLGILLVAVVFVWIFWTKDLLDSLHQYADLSVVIISALVSVAIIGYAITISRTSGIGASISWLLDGEAPPQRKVASPSDSFSPEHHKSTSGQKMSRTNSPESKTPIGSEKAPSISLDRLRSMSPYQFEEFVAKLWNTRGWDARTTTDSDDGGVDVIAEHDLVTGEDRRTREMIQVKQKGEGYTVGVKVIRNLNGSELVKPKDNLVVVTTGTYTSRAKESAEKNDVELIDKDRLMKMVRENESDIEWE